VWAAIRYRRAQAVALMLLSALLTACAVFAPLYERALEQSLLRDGLTRQSALATSIVGESVQSPVSSPQPAGIRGIFPVALLPFYDAGSDLWSGRVTYTGVVGLPSTVQLVGPQDTCRALEITQGTCPSKPYEIAVSAAEAKVQGWQLGAQLNPTEVLVAGQQSQPFPKPFVVTALYRQLDDPGHWQGFGLEGRAGQASPAPADTPLMDGWVTPASTFATGWRSSRLDVVWLVRSDLVTLDGLEAVPPAVEEMLQAGVGKVPAVAVRTSVSDLVAGVVEGQRQARTIVPLLVGQLAVLAVVVLGLVAAAAVEQRRPELALGRLRGLGPAGARRMVMLELGTVVAAGVPVGFLLALLLGEVARRFWLAEGVPFELPSATFVAAVLSLVVALLAVAVVARPTLREPISTLLRRVPPRRAGWAVGVVDAVVVAVAAAGLVTLLSGNLSGPLALATPTLIALALGLVLAHVLIPLADTNARRLTARGRVVGGLTAVQVARRPAVRRIMAIITVATALTIFATDALVVGARNREDRAKVETGAEAVITTAPTDVTSLRNAVTAADPTGAVATPVIEVRQGSAAAMTTLAVVPDQFSRIAELPRDAGAFPWTAISGGSAPEILLSGRAFSLTVSDSTLVLDTQAGATPGAASPTTRPPGVPLGFPGSGLASLIVYLAPVGQGPFTVNLGDIAIPSAGPVTLNHDVACASGCRLVGMSIAPPLGFKGVMRGTLTVSAVTMDGSAPAALGGAAAWLPSGDPDAPADQLRPYAKATDAADATRLGVAVQTTADDVKLTARGSSAPIPALVSGSLPNGSPGPGFQAAGLDGLTLDYNRAAQIPYAPGGGADQAIVNLDVLAAKSTEISALGQAQVWVADADAVPAVTDVLRKAGLAVRSVELRTEREQLFASSASAWGLRLALVVGLLALAIAALVLVLVAVTSWRGRARDYAALRMAGVAPRTLRRVGLAEQWIVVVVSVVVGALSGILGAQLAMPIIPFFTTPSAVLPIDSTLATSPVLLATFAVLVLLLAVGSVVGVRLVDRASLSRVREQL